MRIGTSKSNFALATVLLSVLVMSLTWWSSSHHPTPKRENEGTTPVATRLSRLPDLSESEAEEAEQEPGGAKWFADQRTYPLGYIPKDAEIHAVEYVRNKMIPELAAKGYSLKKSAAGQLNWEFLGPGNIGGRLRGIIVHPNNPNLLYVGSVSGGVWKSTNGGATWSPTMNDLITLNISALAMKPGDPNTLYAGTGEGFFSDGLPGRGILKTTDGSQTWKRIPLNSPFITQLAVSPANPNVVYASGRKALPQVFGGKPSEFVNDPGISAVYKSTDSGETWQDITTGKGIDHYTQFEYDDFATDVEVSSTNADAVYAAFGIRAPGGIWKSTNGGQTWTRLKNGLPDPSQLNQAYNRIELAIAPSNSNILYASFSYLKKQGDTINLNNEGMLGLWKTIDGGQSWTQVNTPMSTAKRNIDEGYTTALGGQGTYANAIIIHPTDPNTIFVAGLDIYKSTDGGNSWTQVSMWDRNPEGLPYVHADHHVFAFDRSTNPPTLYDGSDGGMARSRDLGQRWEILNKNFGVTQFYTFAVHPRNPKIMVGGCQDNGTPIVIDGTINKWFEAGGGGDGWAAFFDPNDPTTLYTSIYSVNMLRLVYDYTTGQYTDFKYIGFTDGANGITQDDVNGSDFFAPYEMSPNNPNVLVLGTNRLLKTTNRGDSWTALTNAINVPIVSVAIAEGNDNIIWLATASARLFKTEDNGASFTEVTGANLPNRFISDIEFDPSNNRTVYVTYSGYGAPHVFKSTDAGGSWTDITNNLPDAPANTIQVHPQQANTIFLGNDVGVFLSEDGGQTWQPAATGFPTVQVTAIVLNTKQNRIYAATHGRGAYSAPLSGGGTAALNVDVAEINITAKPGQTGTAAFNLANSGTATLSYNITATGPTANEGPAGEGFIAHLSNFVSRSSIPDLPKFDFAAATAANGSSSQLQAKPAGAVPSSPARLLGNSMVDALVLDDGNNSADDFIGYGPGSANNFYWLNSFIPSGFNFQLESFDFYMRTESASSNQVYVAVYDANSNILAQGNPVLATAPNGGWYTITLDNPMTFNDRQRFSLLVCTSFAIPYPAGADVDAAVPNQSFFFNPQLNTYVSLNTISGFQNGAFLIRAKGTKAGGGNQPPVANATVSANQARVGQAITLDASGSFDPDGQITQYLWNFGDGSTSNQKITTHAYSQAGTYTVTLTVTDNQGATGLASGQITITANNQPPIARAQISPNPAPVNQPITFDASASSDPDGQITQYLWIFGDGNNSNQKIATHTYSQAGTYSVTLTVTDNQGATGQVTTQVTATSTTPSRLTVTPANGTVAPNGTQTITVAFDAQGLAEGSYQGQLSITSNGGNRTLPVKIKVSNTLEVKEPAELPATFRLEQNYPNPFWSEATSRFAGNPETVIRYELPQASQIFLTVFDLNGRRVAPLASGLQRAGVHLVRWDGRDSAGNRVPSGVYFYRLEIAETNSPITTLMKKMTMLK